MTYDHFNYLMNTNNDKILFLQHDKCVNVCKLWKNVFTGMCVDSSAYFSMGKKAKIVNLSQRSTGYSRRRRIYYTDVKY